SSDSAKQADGTVRKVDTTTGKLTIAHGPLEGLGMPSMTTGLSSGRAVAASTAAAAKATTPAEAPKICAIMRRLSGSCRWVAGAHGKASATAVSTVPAAASRGEPMRTATRQGSGDARSAAAALEPVAMATRTVCAASISVAPALAMVSALVLTAESASFRRNTSGVSPAARSASAADLSTPRWNTCPSPASAVATWLISPISAAPIEPSRRTTGTMSASRAAT
ncbi:MAG: copper-binding protein, partial [Rhizobiales bacterium]|nr:copper-binding protein [Hyphomicrobiales bacterium]